jgi:hypothetical protein
MNTTLSFEEYFHQTKSPPNPRRFILIIGSGIHKEFLRICTKEACNFKCWKHLLISLAESKGLTIRPSNFPIVDFEKLVVECTGKNLSGHNSKPANHVERSLLKKIKDLLKTNKLSSDELNSYPLEIFNSKYISDVINLNFDLVIEEVLTQKKSQKSCLKLKSYSPKNQNGAYEGIYKLPNFQYREINKIKFWHPHGDIKHLNSMILGLRKYGMQIQRIEKLRNRYKAAKSDTKPRVKTWLDPLMMQPILILGTDISHNEWDILFAMISKKRNRARLGSDEPIFQMSENHTNSNLRDWAAPISNEPLSFREQWNLLLELFKTKTHEKN